MTTNQATYCPEDNKLRLYVGRVPRDEYLKLRADGWTSTPKQDCDFVATWTPSRRDTCLEYADLIEDEDQTPEERSADRAERFGEYRDKRHDEATGHADRFDQGPAVHGFQSQSRADRSAARHDRIGTRAVDAWSKAEYWQRRTAGVIGHALHKSTPAVRMGRIKTIEAELRKARKSIEDAKDRYAKWVQISTLTDPAKQKRLAEILAGSGCEWSKYPHPETGVERDLYDMLREDSKHPITGAQACALWLSKHGEPADETEWTTHYELRLAYENQMIEAQGGRAASVEMEVGGFIGNYQIHKVNKSPATGRVVSVSVKVPKVERWTYRTTNVKGTDYALSQLNTERMASNVYRPPTDEERAAFIEARKAEKAAKPKVATTPLINPTLEEAQRLQDMLNAVSKAEREEHKRRYHYGTDHEPSTVCTMTQAVYSANSKGTYRSCSTRPVFAGGAVGGSGYRGNEELRKQFGPPVAEIRQTHGENYQAPRIIVLTDRPAKPLPASVWTKPVVAALLQASESFA